MRVFAAYCGLRFLCLVQPPYKIKVLKLLATSVMAPCSQHPTMVPLSQLMWTMEPVWGSTT